ncbi:Lsr2 family protein [Arthrobacter sp. ISL-48]|uniref:histone-like nucleoid-structuring protein Lsr2 n=1 Tax=Arthrobacter sp. ISL-48 TaxID=2819110 RepID=UPI001BECD936|nr:Lsr2 family protein [Arthrobacter sp. ISL-48]MBT2533574.1 Lsr2 family protein [Arthrobacter sp. ISL-48]
MAKKVEITLVDDLDGSTADETMLFGIDGVNYEIDLSGENAARLRSALAEFTAAGRKTTTPTTTLARRQRPGITSPAKIRQWATENGYVVNRRGRLQAEIELAYHSSNS